MLLWRMKEPRTMEAASLNVMLLMGVMGVFCRAVPTEPPAEEDIAKAQVN